MMIPLVVVFRNGTPLTVFAMDDAKSDFHEFDVSFCKRDGELISDHYGRTSRPFKFDYRDDQWWATPGAKCNGYKKHQMKELPPEWPMDVIVKAVNDNVIEEGISYCSICDDYFPRESHCEHIAWCDRCAWWDTPSDGCHHTGAHPAPAGEVNAT